MARAALMPGRRFSGSQRYPRAARVNEVLREVLAEAVERMSDTDDRLALLTITAVQAGPDVSHAAVLFASLSDEARQALEEARPRLQAAVAAQVRFKRTPQLSFSVDPAITTGQRIEDILRDLRVEETHGDEPGKGPG